jgi:hypothetical protein
MSSAEDLLNDLAGIGATIEPAGNRLVLRAGPTTIPATLVGQIRKAKHELMATLVAREERGVVQTDNVRRCGRKTLIPRRSRNEPSATGPSKIFIPRQNSVVHGLQFRVYLFNERRDFSRPQCRAQ